MEELLTTDELATYLKVHEMTLYKLLQVGDIPAIKVGRRWRFKREMIDEWLKVREKDRKTFSPIKREPALSKSKWDISVNLEKREEDLFDVFDIKIELATKVYKLK